MTTRYPSAPLLAAMLAAGGGFAQSDTRESLIMQASEERVMALRHDFGLDSRHGFKATRTYEDLLGQSIIRLDQYFQGVPVWGGEFIEFVDPVHGVMTPTNASLAGIELSTEPTLSRQEVLGFVESARVVTEAYSQEPTAQLIIYPIQEQVLKPGASAVEPINACDLEFQVREYRLAYHVHTESTGERDGSTTFDHWDFIVDAHTGEILDKWDSLITLEERARAKGRSQYNGTVTFDTSRCGGSYAMKDPKRGKGHKFGALAVTNANNCSDNSSDPGQIYTDDDDNWGDGRNYSGGPTNSANGQTAAVDAMYALQGAWDFMKNVLRRNGMDGRGTATYVRVHVGKRYDNAYWNPSVGAMSFGDGGSMFKNLACIDVLGHELSHGICTHTAGLISNKGESGGLSEGNADIGGTMIEFYIKGGGLKCGSSSIPERGGDWGIGMEIMKKSGGALRFMNKPSKDGKNDDAYKKGIGNKDCHHSAGPLNRFFYFLSQGATTSGESSATSYLPKGMKGIGNDKAFRIWFQAMIKLPKSATYVQARESSIKAAQCLYRKGSQEEAAVHNAWGGVNVGKVWQGSSPNPDNGPKPPKTPKPKNPKKPKKFDADGLNDLEPHFL